MYFKYLLMDFVQIYGAILIPIAFLNTVMIIAQQEKPFMLCLEAQSYSDHA